MKAQLLTVLFCFAQLFAFTQTSVNGQVTDNKGEPLVGANVYLEGTYDGASTDSTGRFTFNIRETSGMLIASYLGYETYKEPIHFDGSSASINIRLREELASVEEVVITAGAFEASDEKKGVVLKPLDIVTTAGALGDINAALNTLPGTQTVGEEGQLFVRGGAASETRTFIDGLRVQTPYTSQVPDVPARGRFSPFMFKGTLFSTGGYSAEFGQALSSALILNTEDMPEKSVTGISLMTVGPEISHTQRWKNTAVSGSVGFTDLSPYTEVVNQWIDWEKPVRAGQAAISLRQKTSETGIFKTFVSGSQSRMAIRFPSLERAGEKDFFSNHNDNIFINSSFTEVLGDSWKLQAGATYTFNRELIEFTSGKVDAKEQSAQAKVVLTRYVNRNLTLKMGATTIRGEFDETFTATGAQNSIQTVLTEQWEAAFAEGNVRIAPKVTARIGVRGEHSSLINRANLAPRLSMAYQTGKASQISMAYGQYYQTPENQLLRVTTDLDFERADHYILNYQFMKNDRTFRVEGYYKTYHNLVKFDPQEPFSPGAYSNGGSGYARGMDIFWRDRKTFDRTDYWISYSYLDTEREFRDFPTAAVPTFASAHNFSFVGKYFVTKWRTQFGGTYSYASPRPFHNPNEPGFNAGRTPHYHDLSLNLSYLTDIKDHFTILHVAVTNVLGREQVFGYRYGNTPGPDGLFASNPIGPPARRFFFVGLFVSIE
ncbi:MAG: TonB-dependent receptor [Bacteroidota bacterium]